MLTIEKIRSDFSYVEALTGNSEVYHDSTIFDGHSNLCDLYFKAKDKQIKQEQVDKYNEFRESFKKYLPEIDRYILNSLTSSEMNLTDLISESKLTLDIIEVPFDNSRYDLVLVCSKTYKKFFFLTRNIDIRIEFKNGRILTIQRKKDTTVDNE